MNSGVINTIQTKLHGQNKTVDRGRIRPREEKLRLCAPDE